MNEKYYEGMIACCDRYNIKLIQLIEDSLYWGEEEYFTINDATKLKLFVSELRINLVEKDPRINKWNRWLGYIQGMMIAAKITTVEEERDFTRPLFAELDNAEL